VRVVGRLKQDRWSDQDGKGRSKVFIVAEHVEFKPQLKKDGDEKEEAPAEEAGTEEEQAHEDAELKEAASF